MVLQEFLQVTATQREVREIKEGRREEQSPEPAELHKVHVKEIVGAGEVRLGEGAEV